MEFLLRTWAHLCIQFTKCGKGVFSLCFPKIYSGPLIYSLLNWASLTQESCREMKRNERHVWVRVHFNWSRILNRILHSSRKPNKQAVKMEHKTPPLLTGVFAVFGYKPSAIPPHSTSVRQSAKSINAYMRRQGEKGGSWLKQFQVTLLLHFIRFAESLVPASCTAECGGSEARLSGLKFLVSLTVP